MILKGLRDIRTRCPKLPMHRAIPKTRAQVMAELVFQERDAARFERELNICSENAKRTESRLQLIRQRIGLLQGLLDGGSSAPRKSPSPEEGDGNQDQQQAPAWREMPLEY